jgi:hypothetical protein
MGKMADLGRKFGLGNAILRLKTAFILRGHLFQKTLNILKN